ncbi:MAG: hypothetical protein H6625_01540 [Bdellovibrionaceae bacterium]|nr:hypothetical protein [Pseudobdellovibrionaceae bacterium]
MNSTVIFIFGLFIGNLILLAIFDYVSSIMTRYSYQAKLNELFNEEEALPNRGVANFPYKNEQSSLKFIDKVI